MRSRARFVAPVILLLCFVAASCPPDRAAKNTLEGLRTTAEHAVAVMKAGRISNPPIFTAVQELQARDLYSKYLAADKIAAEALYAVSVKSDTDALIAAVSKAVADLVAFVDSLKKVP
jgi:hypothetical protein